MPVSLNNFEVLKSRREQFLDELIGSPEIELGPSNYPFHLIHKLNSLLSQILS